VSSLSQRLRVFVAVAALALGTSRSASAGVNASLEQVRNGTATATSTPTPTWVSGNAGASNSHYLESHSIPYRAVMTGLPTNGTVIEITDADTSLPMVNVTAGTRTAEEQDSIEDPYVFTRTGGDQTAFAAALAKVCAAVAANHALNVAPLACPRPAPP